VTVLSRCQRFDLRRIEPEVMIALLKKIAASEDAQVADDALALITRAAEGSARDATSLLDQAISHGAGETTAQEVRAMLGLADRGRVLDLFDMILRGDAAGALNELSSQYSDGADPMAVLRDLAEITHWTSVVKITPEAADDPTIGPDERARGLQMAETLPMRVLTRMWQMLLKALEEVAGAPNSMMAAEMAVIRLTHVADLPSPEELLRKLKDTPLPPTGPAGGGTSRSGSSGSGRSGSGPSGGGASTHGASGAYSATAQTHAQTPQQPRASTGNGAGQTLAVAADPALAQYPTFHHVIELIRHNRDVKLLVEVETSLQLAAYRPGRIEFVPTDAAPRDLAQHIGNKLQLWTGNRWAVTVVNSGGAPTIASLRDAKDNAMRADAEAHPLMLAVLAQFPQAKITAIRTAQDIAAAAVHDALPEVEDEWDPFEDS
jgi:DNA polymerase-3 subunit gamma/tau